MNVYQTDLNHYYLYTLVLDDTDKSPSGTFNIPGGCVTKKPPKEKDGCKIKWNGSKWEFEEIPKDESEEILENTVDLEPIEE